MKLRLYPPAPNVQRQAREDNKVDSLTVPNGTNMWIDAVAMHHDRELWGEMLTSSGRRGLRTTLMEGVGTRWVTLPFGFGGRNLSFREYKIV